MEQGALQFDGWTVDRISGEIARDGRRSRLPQKPLRILLELFDRAGTVVAREQLVKALWPSGVVDFDNGLNVAVRKLRVALDDIGDVPRYIETLPKVGYRFIGKVGVAQAIPTAATPEPSPPDGRARSSRTKIAIGVGVVAVAVAAAWFLQSDDIVTATHHVPSPRAQELYVQGMHHR